MPFTISEKIQLIARKKGIKMQDLAAALGVSRQALHSKLKRDVWSADDLRKFSALLGCSFDPVFTDTKTGEKF